MVNNYRHLYSDFFRFLQQKCHIYMTSLPVNLTAEKTITAKVFRYEMHLVLKRPEYHYNIVISTILFTSVISLNMSINFTILYTFSNVCIAITVP